MMERQVLLQEQGAVLAGVTAPPNVSRDAVRSVCLLTARLPSCGPVDMGRPRYREAYFVSNGPSADTRKPGGGTRVPGTAPSTPAASRPARWGLKPHRGALNPRLGSALPAAGTQDQPRGQRPGPATAGQPKDTLPGRARGHQPCDTAWSADVKTHRHCHGS